MLEFKKLDYASIPEVKQYFDTDNGRYMSKGVDITCDLAFGTTFLWRDYYKTQYAVLGDTLILQITNGGIVMYSTPFGNENIPDMLEAVREYCHGNGESLYFCFVPEADLSYLRENFSVVFESIETDWYDYVYDKRCLTDFCGRKYHRQKNHVNKFMKMNPDAEFIQITSENSGIVRSYAEKWYRKYSDNSDMSVAEEKAVYDLLDNWDDNMCFAGGFLLASGTVLGFTIGETVGDTVYVHVEKAEHAKDGGYQFLSSAYLRSITDDCVIYVNREEDMGIEGLRKSKESLRPIKMLKKYTAYCC